MALILRNGGSQSPDRWLREPRNNQYVKEFGEGVDRMYREMAIAGLPDPEYHVSSFMLCATLKNQKWIAVHQQTGQVDNLSIQNDKITAILDFCSIPRSIKEIQTYLGLTGRNNFYDTSLHRIYK